MQANLPAELLMGALSGVLKQTARVEPVKIGVSGAQVFQLIDGEGTVSFLKICRRDVPLSLAEDVARLNWLAGRLPVPPVLAYYEELSYQCLWMLAIPGVDSATLATERQMEMGQLVRLLADGLRQFHAVPIADCPFDHCLAHEMEWAKLQIDREQDQERKDQAKALFESLSALLPSDEDLVLTHGDYCLPNIMLANDQVSGFIDLGLAGIGDRYRDLALARRSLIRNCGAEWVPLFFERYGLPQPNEAKLLFYQRLDEFY